MDRGQVANDAELSTAAVGACDEPTDAVGNSGRTTDFILCCLAHRRQVGKVELIGRGVIKAQMRPIDIEAFDVLGNVGARSADAVIRLEIHALVFHTAPETLDEHVVTPRATPVHAELAAPGQQNVGELRCSELTALVGVDDLRRAVAQERLLNHLFGMAGLQRDCHLVRQHLAAGHIHHRRQVHEAPFHRNVGRIEGPHLVGAGDGQLAQQVGVDLVPRVSPAGCPRRLKFDPPGQFSVGVNTRMLNMTTL